MINRLLRSRWPSLIWTVMIFFLLTINTGSMESMPLFGIKNLDKVVHICLFAALAFLWFYRLNKGQGKIWLWIPVLTSLYGIGMEYYQEYFTSREFELNDIYADITGVVIGSLIGKKIGPYGNRGRNQN
jgi:hypothetical protein